ncbi:MAG: Fur family transcriptional regulator [Candidatus Bilamarchaeum sp.]
MVRISRKTKQKESIENEIKGTKSFFTAEDLFEKLKKKDSTIGIATIYRFLKQKNENGELHSYRCGSKNLYSNELQSHSHFICKDCNKTTHINIQDLAAIKNSIKGDMCHFQLDIYGICETCKRKRVNDLNTPCCSNCPNINH